MLRPPGSARFAFFAGKGGVGKTTLAAAHALGVRGRTLIVSTDPAHSLGDALALRLTRSPRRVTRSLWAAEMDADRALARWFSARERALRTLALRGTYLDADDVDALLRQSLPGVDELIGLVELLRLARGFDRVVVDTAPTGHTLRLLAMPQTLANFARVLHDLQGKHRYLSESLRGRYLPDATDAVISGIEAQVEEIGTELRERSAFHWVLLPEELALREAEDGIAGLHKLGVRVAEVVVNRVLAPPPGPCALCRARRAAEARVVARARRALDGLPMRLVPAADEEPRGLAALRRLSRARSAVRTSIQGHQPKFGKTVGVPDFVEALAGPRLVLFGGKGGVGKTTCAAAFALERAAAGARVLLLSTDPAHSLGDAFDEPVGDPGREIAPRLHARELDADRAFAHERHRYRTAVDDLFDDMLRPSGSARRQGDPASSDMLRPSSSARGQGDPASSALRGGVSFDATFDRVVVQDLIDLAPPGLDELFALVAIVGELPRFECVVVDTAPTGHALRLLELPEKALGWVHAILEILLKYRRVIGLGDLARTLTGTARDLRQLGDLLRDPARCRFVPVTRAAELPRVETERLVRALRRLKVPSGPLLVVARTPPGCARCRKAAEREEAHLTRLRRLSPAMLQSPLLPVPPRGAAALRRFAGSWTRA